MSQGFEEYGPYDQQYWGDSLNPPRRTLLLPTIGQEILDAENPPIRMIYVTAANPACMAPNSDKVAQAFRQAEFVVYSGHLLDDTAELAHVFLPATTFLEEDDAMASYGHNYLGPVNRAIEPVGECKSEFQMFYELSSRFPFAHYFQRSVDDWLRDLLAPAKAQGLDMAEFKTRPFRLNAPMVPYADRTFPTPSGKFRLLSHLDPVELPDADPRYPYKLLTIAPHAYICSERTMADHEPLPEVRLGLSEAVRLGLADGQVVVVESAVGSVKACLRTAEGQRPDVLVADRGGWIKAGHGLNRLTRDMASTVGNGTPYYETAVTVRPCRETGLEGVRVLVVQQSPHAPGGNFCKELERQGAQLDLVHPAEGQALPTGPAGYDALVALGGPQHAFDDEASPYFPALMALMRAFEAQDKPVAGICLGAQLLARAHGGQVTTMDRLELGFVQTTPTQAFAQDPVLGGLDVPRLMEFHQDAFDLPDCATALLSGDYCPGQCFRTGRASYGFQFHLEADSPTIAQWLQLFRSGSIDAYAADREQFSETFFAELQADLPLLMAGSEHFCRQVAGRWLGCIGSKA